MPPVQRLSIRLAVRPVLLLALSAWLLPSCLGPGYGGRPIDVELHTKPEGKTVYVLHEDQWAKSGRPLFNAFEKARGKDSESQARKALLDWLEDHRVREKTTPVHCTVSSYHQVLVARNDPQIDYLEFDPVANKAPCLEFSAHD